MVIIAESCGKKDKKTQATDYLHACALTTKHGLHGV